MRLADVLRATCLSLGLLAAHFAAAQEIVHALSGTVEKIDPAAKTLLLKTNDGSEGLFQLPTGAGNMEFDHEVKARTTPAVTFTETGTEVILYFYGNGDVRTAVAVQNLGNTHLLNTEGTVTRFDKHRRALTIRTTAGAVQNFQVDPKAVADTSAGVVDGQRFEPVRGDNLRIVASSTNGAGNALFLREQ